MWYSPARSNKTMSIKKPPFGGDHPGNFLLGVITALLVSINFWAIIYFTIKYFLGRGSE